MNIKQLNEELDKILSESSDLLVDKVAKIRKNDVENIPSVYDAFCAWRNTNFQDKDKEKEYLSLSKLYSDKKAKLDKNTELLYKRELRHLRAEHPEWFKSNGNIDVDKFMES